MKLHQRVEALRFVALASKGCLDRSPLVLYRRPALATVAAGPVRATAAADPRRAMVGVVGTVFTEVGRGPEIVCLFRIAALLWLSILLGMGSLDPLTRIEYLGQAAIQDNAEHPLCMLRLRAIANAPPEPVEGALHAGL